MILPVSERKRNSVVAFFKDSWDFSGSASFHLNLKNNHPVDTADQLVKIR